MDEWEQDRKFYQDNPWIEESLQKGNLTTAIPEESNTNERARADALFETVIEGLTLKTWTRGVETIGELVGLGSISKSVALARLHEKAVSLDIDSAKLQRTLR